MENNHLYFLCVRHLRYLDDYVLILGIRWRCIHYSNCHYHNFFVIKIDVGTFKGSYSLTLEAKSPASLPTCQSQSFVNVSGSCMM